MAKTIEQRIADKQDELQRLKDKARKLENGQKIIVGSMMLSIAENEPKIAKYLLDAIEKNVTRDADLKRLASVKEDLKTWSMQTATTTTNETYQA